MLLAAVILILAGCSVADTHPTGPIPSLVREPASAEAVNGPYRLIFEMPSTMWREGETITGEARIELLEGDAVEVAGSSSPGLVAFEFVELSGRWKVQAVWTSDCGGQHRLTATDPVVLALQSTGGAASLDAPEDPNWYREFLVTRDVQLPGGQWDITAIAHFSETWDCPPPSPGIGMEATIRVTVVP